MLQNSAIKESMKMTHVEKAKKYFEEYTYHCSQAVIVAFAEELGITDEQALKLGGCFGGGMCKGEVCGACTGALMALGLKYGQSEVEDLESRAKASEVAVQFLDTFAKENGSYICKEILGYDLAKPEDKLEARAKGLFTTVCPKMVESAVKIVEGIINE